MQVPILTDQAVTLRTFTAADAPALYGAIRESFPQLTRWLAWADRYLAASEADAWIASLADRRQQHIAYDLGIFDTQSGALLGGTGLSRLSLADRSAHLGYWVRTSASQRGIATRAARLWARHALTALPFHRVEILTAVGNLPSQRVARKLGAKFGGIARDRIWIRETAHDAHVYSLLRSDPIGRAS